MPDISLRGCGINTRHSPRVYFEDARGSGDWLLMCFHTPFFYKLGGEVMTGGVGDCLLHPPGTYTCHGPAERMTEGFCNDWLYFNGEDAERAVSECALPINRSFHIKDGGLVGARIREIMDERDRRLLGGGLRISACIVNLLVDLGRQLSGGGPEADKAYQIISGVRNRMLENYAESWTLEGLAKLSGYSPSRFSVLYRKYFKTSPISDLILTRVTNAKNLLLYGEYSVSEIAELCGFTSLQYFSRTYKSLTGETPSKVNKNRRQNINVT